MKDRLKYRVFGVILIVILCIGLTFKYLQNDTFYIIKLGDFIVHHGIDSLDHYSWVANLPYTYPHWLYDVGIYFIYHAFGYLGVYVSTIIFFIILILIIYYINLKIHKHEFLALLVSLICVFRLSMFAVARSQIISLSLFLLEVYFIFSLIKTGKNRYIIYLMIASLLVANIHGTAWLFYFVLFLPFIGEYFVFLLGKNKIIRNLYHLDNFSHSRIIIEKIPYIKKLMMGMFLSFMMGIFTPSRICYTYVFRIMMGNSQNVLLEHLPLTVISHPFFLVMILLLVITFIFTNVKVYLREVFMIMGLLLMCLMSGRHLSFFYTIALIDIVWIIYRALEECHDYTLDLLGDMMIHRKVVLITVLVIVIFISGSQFCKHLKEKYVPLKDYPVNATKYIKSHLNYLDMRLYNGYNYGSYLMFQDIPVFIDSRCDLYLKEFNGMKDSIFDEMEDIEFKYEKKFKKYNVSHVLLSKREKFYMILLKDIHYTTLYEDKYFILFERME